MAPTNRRATKFMNMALNIRALVAKLEVTGSDFGEVKSACSELIGILVVKDFMFDEKAAVLAHNGGAAAAMHLMEKCPKDVIIQQCGCLILRHTATVDTDCKKEIQDKGGIPLLVTALANFMNDEIVRHAGLYAIGAFVAIAPAAVLDGFPVILREMKHHLEDTKSQQIACDLVAMLTYKEHFGTIAACDHGTLLVNAGCIPILTEWLEHTVRQPKDIQDKDLALGILRAFSQLIGANTESTARELVEYGPLGFAATLLDVMRRWNDCVDIQFHACSVLAVCRKFWQQDTAAVVERGGIALLVEAIKLFLQTTSKSDQHLMRCHLFAMFVLGYVCQFSVESVNALQRAHGLPVIINVMQEHFPNGSRDSKNSLHDISITLLRNCFAKLVNNRTHRVRDFISEMIASGTVPTTLMSMRQFEKDVYIQTSGCILLAAMSDIGESGLEIVVNDGRNIIERAVMHHEDDEYVQKYGNETLERLSGIDEIDRCHTCFASTEDLMHCSRCMKVFYCNRKCQKEDYKLHKKLCKQMANRASTDDSP